MSEDPGVIRRELLDVSMKLDATEKRCALLRSELTRTREALKEAQEALGEAQGSRTTVERVQGDYEALRGRLAAVLDLCAKEQHSARRWEDPLPVPEWVGLVQRLVTGEVLRVKDVPPNEITDSVVAAAEELRLEPEVMAMILNVWEAHAGRLVKVGRNERRLARENEESWVAERLREKDAERHRKYQVNRVVCGMESNFGPCVRAKDHPLLLQDGVGCSTKDTETLT